VKQASSARAIDAHAKTDDASSNPTLAIFPRPQHSGCDMRSALGRLLVLFGQKEQTFFFEKKKQKTFGSLQVRALHCD
jgi:hypothetical protein